jgi:hypothetical protein
VKKLLCDSKEKTKCTLKKNLLTILNELRQKNNVALYFELQTIDLNQYNSILTQTFLVKLNRSVFGVPSCRVAITQSILDE